jgi:peroxiredoxin
MSLRLFVFGIALVAVLGVLASCRPPSTASTSSKPAPDFTLTSLQGKSVTLSSLQGKVVVLDFWATWCPPCRASLPHTQGMSQSANTRAGDLVVLAVNAREDATTVRSFLKQHGYTFTVLMDTQGAAMEKYGVSGIPTFVVIDRKGNITWQRSGFDEHGLTKAVDAALAEK